MQNTFEALDSVHCNCCVVNEKYVENFWKYDCRRQDVYTVMCMWFNINSHARFSVHIFIKAAAIFSLKVMEVLRYKESLCQWMFKEKGMSLTFLLL